MFRFLSISFNMNWLHFLVALPFSTSRFQIKNLNVEMIRCINSLYNVVVVVVLKIFLYIAKLVFSHWVCISALKFNFPQIIRRIEHMSLLLFQCPSIFYIVGQTLRIGVFKSNFSQLFCISNEELLTSTVREI